MFDNLLRDQDWMPSFCIYVWSSATCFLPFFSGRYRKCWIGHAEFLHPVRLLLLGSVFAFFHSDSDLWWAPELPIRCTNSCPLNFSKYSGWCISGLKSVYIVVLPLRKARLVQAQIQKWLIRAWHPPSHHTVWELSPSIFNNQSNLDCYKKLS